jgi:hypothetical protein
MGLVTHTTIELVADKKMTRSGIIDDGPGEIKLSNVRAWLLRSTEPSGNQCPGPSGIGCHASHAMVARVANLGAFHVQQTLSFPARQGAPFRG